MGYKGEIVRLEGGKIKPAVVADGLKCEEVVGAIILTREGKVVAVGWSPRGCSAVTVDPEDHIVWDGRGRRIIPL